MYCWKGHWLSDLHRTFFTSSRRGNPWAASPRLASPSVVPERPAHDSEGDLMKLTCKKKLAIGGVLVLGAVAAAVAIASPATDLTAVPAANTKSAGYAPASVLSPELAQIAVAQGSTKVESPSTEVSYYGYDNDVLGPGGQPLMVPTPVTPATEAHKTEPDKNTYLVFEQGLTGADPAYNDGTHFLFQGHEAGSPGYIT